MRDSEDELAAREDAAADQLDMAVRDVARFGSPALSMSDPGAKLRRKRDWVLEQSRQRFAVEPVWEDGVLGGLDGSATRGNNDATHFAPGSTSILPEYDPANPGHLSTPIIVLAWNLNHRWIVRAPDSIEDIIGGFAIPWTTECDWHFGPVKADSNGSRQRSVLVLPKGQFIALMHVCAACVERLRREYGNGLRLLPLSQSGRALLPQD